ncbi:NAD(P)H-dependent oxidoreductase [Xanthobacter sp. KR7-225]|uniref:NAD(P)H-dependent oxidoreductase n=1 Tax=Xanthobacter sp. KR7-225 TaxID=3156613 RepID=UPI0032B430B2
MSEKPEPSSNTVLVIQGHPDPEGGHLCHALAQAYAEGARKAGHRVIVVDVARLDFPLLRSQEDFLRGEAPAALAEARGALLEARHVALFFPLWLGTMPALLKGFLEQLMRPGFAYAYAADGKGFPKGLLEGRTARIVVTMGMPALVFRLWYLSAGLEIVRRNIFGLVGITLVRTSAIGGVEGMGERRRAGWLASMDALGAAGR